MIDLFLNISISITNNLILIDAARFRLDCCKAHHTHSIKNAPHTHQGISSMLNAHSLSLLPSIPPNQVLHLINIVVNYSYRIIPINNEGCLRLFKMALCK